MLNMRRLLVLPIKLYFPAGLLVIILGATLLAPLISPFDPIEVNLNEVYTAPSSEYFLGTDHMGRDVFSRLLYGGQISLSISVLAVAISGIIGITIGAISGYFGGWIDTIFMRIIETFIAIPSLILILALQAIIQGSVTSMVIIIGLTSWMTTARVVRSQFLELRDKEFVKIARLMGTPPWKIVVVHLLRNSLSGIFVVTIFNCAHAIFTEVSLSFLGIGVPPETPSWGNMLYNAQNDVLTGAWWVAIFPGVMIFLSLLSINFLGEALKERYGIKGNA